MINYTNVSFGYTASVLFTYQTRHFIRAVRTTVVHPAHNGNVVGSTPTRPTTTYELARGIYAALGNLASK